MQVSGNMPQSPDPNNSSKIQRQPADPDATSSETLEEIEEKEEFSNPATSTESPSPDGRLDVVRDGRTDGAESADPT